MNQQLQQFLENLLANIDMSGAALRLVLSSLVLIIVVAILRSIVAKFIRKSVKSTELRKRWLKQIRTAMWLLLLLGMVMIWGAELRTLALSLVAIAVALVVATKELILCLTGTLVKNGARSFQVGDRIQVKDFRGDVMDQNMLATTIWEVGPGKLTHQRTGRRIVLPNSMFVSEPVVNESYANDYVLHVFVVPFSREDDWPLAQEKLLEAANKQCEYYIEHARHAMKRLHEANGMEPPHVEPRVSLLVPSAAEIHLVVRLPTKAVNRSGVEQAILAEVFSQHNFKKKADVKGTPSST